MNNVENNLYETSRRTAGARADGGDDGCNSHPGGAANRQSLAACANHRKTFGARLSIGPILIVVPVKAEADR
jgi:hypothetical protein